ncbi:hydrogenase maturation nickel metallochaperone HypA [Desulfonatronovibrio magnus]|uniref:hydrogenase maturation nickel metallochaperone HypA n=1 Tax=Desulfonatronovibrio magnus TaxID=698827 RepID=UPI0005EB4F3F|nr:hydrogenase maturation nickel metallochaperone HypA [Desulfonatronovibrio magnus]RQD65494.1 MAG: hydrogenase maturation nickel metallochaperone HypA [Desulfonatronovibrio sp. MSAO_Bac4]
MHEMSIAHSLVEIIKQEMAKHGVTRLIRVKVKYGRISAIVPEALQTAFEAMTMDTDLQGAILEIEEVPLQARCRECRKEFAPEGDLLIMTCPHCRAEFGHEIISGKDLYIDELEAE